MILDKEEAEVEIIRGFGEESFYCLIARVTHKRLPLPVLAGYIRIAESEEEVRVTEYKGIDNTYTRIRDRINSVALTYSGMVEEAPNEMRGYYIGFDTQEPYNRIPDHLPEEKKIQVVEGALKDTVSEIKSQNLEEVLLK